MGNITCQNIVRGKIVLYFVQLIRRPNLIRIICRTRPANKRNRQIIGTRYLLLPDSSKGCIRVNKISNCQCLFIVEPTAECISIPYNRRDIRILNLSIIIGVSGGVGISQTDGNRFYLDTPIVESSSVRVKGHYGGIATVSICRYSKIRSEYINRKQNSCEYRQQER
jgi:hypothetical protein